MDQRSKYSIQLERKIARVYGQFRLCFMFLIISLSPSLCVCCCCCCFFHLILIASNRRTKHSTCQPCTIYIDTMPKFIHVFCSHSLSLLLPSPCSHFLHVPTMPVGRFISPLSSPSPKHFYLDTFHLYALRIDTSADSSEHFFFRSASSISPFICTPICGAESINASLLKQFNDFNLKLDGKISENTLHRNNHRRNYFSL